MVIPSANVRLVSSELALKILKPSQTATAETTPRATATTDTSASYAPKPGVRSNVSDAWVRNLATETDIPKNLQQVWTAVPPFDVASSSFKDDLRGRLTTSMGWSTYASEQVQALDAGTMTIESPDMNAWDVQLFDTQGQYMGSTGKYDGEGWTDYLNDHLARDGNGNYLRTASGAYVDRATGQSADMGQVGGAVYYMTWPTRKV